MSVIEDFKQLLTIKRYSPRTIETYTNAFDNSCASFTPNRQSLLMLKENGTDIRFNCRKSFFSGDLLLVCRGLLLRVLGYCQVFQQWAKVVFPDKRYAQIGQRACADSNAPSCQHIQRIMHPYIDTRVAR